MKITVLCGGVGAARFLRGLLAVAEPADITAVVNTGDDCVLHGLSISPDLDTITYTLAGAIDPERGWGLAGETWHAIEALQRFADVRPPDSTAGATWFNLGDRDLATHLYRTGRLHEGASLTEVTDEIRRALGVPITILPMTDGIRHTVVDTADHGAVTFQDYFVRLRHDVEVTGIRFVGDGAATADVLASIDGAEAIVIAPSNPLVSIAPVRAIPTIEERLRSRRDSVVAISPIVGGTALKGPADRMLTELGHESSVVGVARLYAPIADTLVIDTVDEQSAAEVGRAGMRCVVTDTVMATPDRAAALASTTLAALS